MARKKPPKAVGNIKLQPATAELAPNQLTIKFDHPHHVLPKLIELAGHFAESHVDLLSEVGPTADVLGGARARVIVSNCAHSTAWSATLSDLGLNPLIFRNCVVKGVDDAGYVAPDLVVGPDTKLLEVVAAIQGAPHK
jgi:hypothetical protein